MASTKRSDGEGSIYYDAARERYVGSLVVGWRDAKPIRRKVSAKSRAGAATKLRELRERVEHGHLPSGKIPTVGEWLVYWLDNIAAEKNRPSTLAAYGTYVHRYLVPLIGRHRLDRLTSEHLSAAWKTLAENGCPDLPRAKPLSPTTIRQAHVITARALKVAQQRGYITKNPASTEMMDAPVAATTEFEILTLEQAKKVIEAARGHRNAARWTVAFALGLRQGEALGLRWQDIDLDDGVMHVRHSLGRVKGEGLKLGPTKSKKGGRVIALPGELVDELKAHRAQQNAERLTAGSWWREGDYVFANEDGRPYDPKADWTLWRARLAEAKVPTVRLHAARHTAATMLLALGVAERVVMEMMGHSHIGITHGYQKRVDELHRDTAKKIGAALWG